MIFFLYYFCIASMSLLISGDEIAGYVTVKHVYEIAKIKRQDACNEFKDLQQLCKMIISQARSIGIKVLKEDLDPREYGKFLDEREEIMNQHEDELLEAKQAKLLRLA